MRPHREKRKTDYEKIGKNALWRSFRPPMDYSGVMRSEASGQLAVRDYHNRDPHGLPPETKAGDGLPLMGEDRSAVHTTSKVAYRAIKGTNNSFDVAGAVTGSKTADDGCSTAELLTDLQGSEPPCPNLVRYELGVLPSGASSGAINGDAGTINGQITFSGTSFSDRGGNIPPRLNQNIPKVLSDGIERAIIIPGTNIIGVNEGVFHGVEPVIPGTGSLNHSGVQDSGDVSSHKGSTVAAEAVLAGPIVGIIADTVHVGYASIPAPNGHAKETVSGISSGVFPPNMPLLGPTVKQLRLPVRHVLAITPLPSKLGPIFHMLEHCLGLPKRVPLLTRLTMARSPKTNTTVWMQSVRDP